MPVLTIIGGVNGVGKSQFINTTKRFCKDYGEIVDADKLTKLHGGNAIAGGKAAVRKIQRLLENNLSFTQETTLSGFSILNNVKQAKEQGYYIRLFYIALDSAARSIARIDDRVIKGGHDIPDATVLRRFTDRWPNLLRVLPYCNEVAFFDNEGACEEVAQFKNGELVFLGEHRPVWLMELHNFLLAHY